MLAIKFTQSLGEWSWPAVHGVPVVGSGEDAVAMIGNPAAVGGDHTNVVDIQMNCGVIQFGESAASVGAVDYKSAVRPHPEATVGTEGESVDPVMSTGGEMHRIPPPTAIRTAKDEIITLHILVGNKARRHNGIVAEACHTVECGFVPEDTFGIGFDRMPYAVEPLGIIYPTTSGHHPDFARRRDTGILYAANFQVNAAVTLLSLHSS